MDDVFVASIMSDELVTVDEDALVATAAQRMLKEGVSSVLVVDDDFRLEGLLTATDFVRLVHENDPEDETFVRAVMTTDVVTTSAQDSLEDLAKLFEHGFTHFPVTTDDREVIGIVSTTDATAYIAGL